MDVDTCGHCGGIELLAIGDERFRCSYCNAILRRRPEKRPIELDIKAGAHIHILKSAHIVVKRPVGKVTIGEGAEIEMAGSLEIEEPGDPDKRR